MTTAQIYPGVTLPETATIGAHVIVGLPTGQADDADRHTRIGERAIIRSHTVIYAGNRIGDDFHAGHGALVRQDNVIGDRVSIGSHCEIGFSVIIGDDVRLHSGVFVPEFTVIEDGAWLGPRVTLTNSRYPGTDGAKQALRAPVIKAGARIGAGATILPGVTIGARAMVGAGAVVVRDVAGETTVVGNPARAPARPKDE